MSRRAFRNWRRAYDKERREIEPVTIGGMIRAHRIRHVEAFCRRIGCGHHGLIPIEGWPPDIYVPDVGLYLVCLACGAKHDAETRPNWRELEAEGRG